MSIDRSLAAIFQSGHPIGDSACPEAYRARAAGQPDAAYCCVCFYGKSHNSMIKSDLLPIVSSKYSRRCNELRLNGKSD